VGGSKRKAPALDRGKDTWAHALARRPIHVEPPSPRCLPARFQRPNRTGLHSPVGPKPSPLPPSRPAARKKSRPRQTVVPDGRSEPEILDGDCTAADLAFALEHLHFARNGLCTLRLDRCGPAPHPCPAPQPCPSRSLTISSASSLTAAGGLPPEKRSVFLQRIAAQLARVRRPGDEDIERAAHAALRGAYARAGGLMRRQFLARGPKISVDSRAPPGGTGLHFATCFTTLNLLSWPTRSEVARGRIAKADAGAARQGRLPA
jgi:hypothetical protein